MTHAPTRQPTGIDGTSDADLIRASVQEPARFDAIFARHARAVYAFACARVGPDNAEDVTAETFAAAFRSRAKYVATCPSARPWLYGIAARTLLRHGAVEARWLDRLRRDAAEAPPREDPLEGTEDRLDARRLAPRLALALAELTQGERDVLLLHVLGELSQEEVADALGIRRGTVKSRLSRGRARLRVTFPDLADHLDHRARGGTR